MALKQMDALAALREAAGEVIETSLCDVQGNWLALVNTEEGKRLAFAAKGEAALSALWKDVEKEADVKDVHVSVMALNANNARWCAAMLNGPHLLPAAQRVPASASAIGWAKRCSCGGAVRQASTETGIS